MTKIKSIVSIMFGVPFKQIHHLAPGCTLVVVLSGLSIWVSKYVGVTLLGFEKSPISAVMIAILLGMVVGNLIKLPSWMESGLNFSAKKILRLGIILLGFRLSIVAIGRLGIMSIPIVCVCIISGIGFTILMSKLLHLPLRLGTLIAVGTSICGVSAIVATAPAIEAEEEEIAYAVSVITLFGMLATLLYPFLANFIFSGDAIKVGLFLGTSIHDTSQVTGAAVVYSEFYSQPEALDTATVTKLVRNIFMIVVIPLMVLLYSWGRKRKQAKLLRKKGILKLIPLFGVGFIFCSLLRSFGDAAIYRGEGAFSIWDYQEWTRIHGIIARWAANFFVAALAAVGLNTRLVMLRGLGIRPLIVGLSASVAVGGISTLMLFLLK